MEINGNVKNYEWGKLGTQSEVAQLAKANTEGFRIEPAVPYAELWMGDHPSGPSTVKANGEELRTILPHSLSFLFKVLSVRKALSIQVHPNKDEARRLHRERPDVYKDPNHKPELAIALTPFVALCGFRPYADIDEFCQKLPPLKRLVGEGQQAICSAKDLRKCYERLMTSESDAVAAAIDEIAKDHMHVLREYDLLETFHTINKDFPHDVGVLSLFFLNLIRLNAGEAIFLGANEIHAYLSGDCIECMACSDNVVRAGLTPKYKDVGQLISCLNYAGEPPSKKFFQPKHLDEFVQLFEPPVDDFAVVRILLPHTKMAIYTVKLPQCPGILLVLKGSRRLRLCGHPELKLQRGSIVYIPPEAMANIELIVEEPSEGEFAAYIATQNSLN